VVWVFHSVDQRCAASAGTNAATVGMDKLAGTGVLYQGLQVLGGGAILGSLILAGITACIIDRTFGKAAGFAAVGSVLTFFGFMHGEAIGIGESPSVALAYLIVAAVLYGCARQTLAKPIAAPHAVAEVTD